MKTSNIISYHNIFLVAGLIMGLSLVFINPPWQSNDEDRHFFNAYSLSQGYWGPVIQNGKPGSIVTTSTRDVVQYLQKIRFDQKDKLSKDRLKDLMDQEKDNKEVFYIHTSATNFPFPYIPSAIAIKIGGVFNSDPIWLGWWGRIGSLLAYIAIVFFAIRIIPHFKAFLTLCALTPMAIYQGASITYDSLSFALLFLLFALTIRFYFQTTPITLKDVAFFCLIALAQKISKDGYFVLYFTLFAVHIKKFEKAYLYYSSLVVLVLISVLPSVLWMDYLYGLGLTNSEIQFRSDYLFDAIFHLKYHLKDPLHLVNLMAQNVFFEGKIWIAGSIGRFGFTYSIFPEWFYLFHIGALIFFVAADQADRLIRFRYQAAYVILALIGIGATITGFYLYLSPIGADTLFNFQGRYLTPCIPFLFLGLFYIPHKPIDPRIIKVLFLAYVIFLYIYLMDYIGERFYLN